MSAHGQRYRLLVLLLAAALPAAQVWSAGLGQIRVHSFLGQPLLASVPIQIGEEDNSTLLNCVSVNKSDPELAGPGRVLHEILNVGNRTTLQLRSIEGLQEPMIGMTLRLGCGEPSVSRTFILLLDPAPVDLVSATPAPEIQVNAQTITQPTKVATPVKIKSVIRKINAASASARVALVKTPATPVVVAPPTTDHLSIKAGEAEDLRMRTEDLEKELQTLDTRHTELRAEMSRLEERMSKLQIKLSGDVLTQTASAAATIPKETTAQTPAKPLRIPTKPTNWIPILGWLGGALTLFSLAGAIWVWLRRKADEDDNDWLHQPVSAPKEIDTISGPLAKTPAALPVEAIKVEEEGDKSDQAQCLLAEGQSLAAIELLYEVIESAPQDSRAWLMLFRALSQRDSTTEFIAEAEKFKLLNPQIEDWEMVCAMGRELDPAHALFQPPVAAKPAVPVMPASGQPILDFFTPAKKITPEEPIDAPQLDLDLPALPEEEPLPSDSTLQHISKRSAA